jgi:hypothetical protein
MAFHMESLTPQAYEDIFREHGALIRRYCVPQEKWNPTWVDKRHAVDPKRRVTFMLIPKFAPNDALNRYLVTCEGEAFVFEIQSNEVKPIDLPLTLSARLTEIRHLIADAFEMHGIFGSESPRPFDIPHPIFE